MVAILGSKCQGQDDSENDNATALARYDQPRAPYPLRTLRGAGGEPGLQTRPLRVGGSLAGVPEKLWLRPPRRPCQCAKERNETKSDTMTKTLHNACENQSDQLAA